MQFTALIKSRPPHFDCKRWANFLCSKNPAVSLHSALVRLRFSNFFATVRCLLPEPDSVAAGWTNKLIKLSNVYASFFAARICNAFMYRDKSKRQSGKSWGGLKSSCGPRNYRLEKGKCLR